jgi:hypothetical protein
MAYATDSNTVYLNLENFVTANDGSHFYTKQTSFDPTNSHTSVIKFDNKQDMVNFIHEQNWRFHTCLQQLYNAYQKIMSDQIIPLRLAHNSAVTAFTTAKADTTWQTATSIDGTDLSDATTHPTGNTDERVKLQTAYLEKLKANVKGTMGTWNFPYQNGGDDNSIAWCYAPRGHYAWWNDCANDENCLANSYLKYDSLYDGCVVGARYRMKLPEYQLPSNNWNNGVFTAQALSMTNYENLWKTYYNTIINLANNVRSGSTVTAKYAIEQCKTMTIPKKYYNIIDGTSGPQTPTSAIVMNNITYTDSWGRFTPESGDANQFFKLIKNIGKDMADWKYNRVPNMFNDLITQANAALETLKQKDSTGEFRKWVTDSGFKIHQQPYGATLVYDDTIQGAGGANIDVLEWEDTSNKYYLAYNPHPTNITFWNPFNRDIYCSKSDITSGRVKINKGDY